MSTIAAPVTGGRALFGLLAVGVLGWVGVLAGSVVVAVVLATTSGTALYGALVALLLGWAIGWPGGGAVMVLWGLVRCGRRRLGPAVVAAAAAVYFGPVLLGGLTLWLGGALRPLGNLESARTETMAIEGAVLIVVLYLAGLGLGFAWRNRSLGRTTMAVLAPPLLGVGLLGGWELASGLTSAEFRHRDAFTLNIERAIPGPAALTVEATLEIRQDGRYAYRALYMEVVGGSRGGRAAFEWPESGEPPQRAGRYRLRLVFDQVTPAPQASDRTLFFEIRERREDGGYQAPLKEFRLPVSLAAGV